MNGGRNYEQDTAHDEGRERNCSSVNKLGYMLERLSILSYEDSINPCFKHGWNGSRNNASSADNQQERPAQAGILRDYTPGISERDEDIVRAAWRHAEVGRNDQPFDAS